MDTNSIFSNYIPEPMKSVGGWMCEVRNRDGYKDFVFVAGYADNMEAVYDKILSYYCFIKVYDVEYFPPQIG